MQTQARRGDRSSLLHSYIGCHRLLMRRVMSSGRSPEISSAFPAPLTPRSAPGFRTSTISEALARATILRAFRLLQEVAMNKWPSSRYQTAVRWMVPICVLGPQGSDVTSSQQFLGSWVKRLSRHLPLQSRARFGKGANLPLLLEHRKQHGGELYDGC